jgi:uroporphyrinogen decarboxylase
MHRFLGYDYVPVGLDPAGPLPLGVGTVAADTAGLAHAGGRRWLDESRGPIQTMEDLEKFPWPDPAKTGTSGLEWFDKHVPDDMCLRAGCHNVFEFVTWAMGYERLCYAIHDDPQLVDALFRKVGELLVGWCKLLLQFDRIKLFLGGDDMGFKTATMVSADLLEEKALVWHKRMAGLCHQLGRVYCLHACGNLAEIMEFLIEEVKLDGRHSFEDAIEPVTVAKKRWGDRLALLGGIDVGFLTRATPEQVRKRTRETLDICMPGGGYCLGTGNSVANYIPVENFLAMLDEGRRYA